MKKPLLFKEYIWLIETIANAGRISFADINERWLRTEASGGLPLARTTFNRHRDLILDMFGIVIDCDRKDGYRYYIANNDVLHEDNVQNWLFSTMSVSSMLDDNMALHNRILLESVPSGNDTLREIIKAMRESRRMTMTYHRYGAGEASTLDAAPLCVKLFRRRWYVLAGLSHGNDRLSIFSLDRIEAIEVQNEKFDIDPGFNAARLFDECFGVVIGDGSKPQRIVLRAYGMERHYMRDLPIHHTQRVIADTDHYTDFEVNLRPTSDFKAHLLSRGAWLQVVSPESLAGEIWQWLNDALERYKKSTPNAKK